jgi:hypothetical protein
MWGARVQNGLMIFLLLLLPCYQLQVKETSPTHLLTFSLFLTKTMGLTLRL